MHTVLQKQKIEAERKERICTCSANCACKQTVFQGQKIEDESKEGILEMLSDKYCRAILKATMMKPKSATKIATETKIPISTIYRRLQDLHDNKLLSISGQISDDGKKLFLYKSKVKAILSTFDGNRIEIEIVPNFTKEAKV